MLEILTPLVEKYHLLQQRLSEETMDYGSKEYQGIQKEYNRLEKIVLLKNQYQKAQKEIEDLNQILKEEIDEEMIAMSKEELANLEKNLAAIEKTIKLSIIPPDPNDEKNIIVEIRAGAGGDEAGIFVGDLFRMYSMFAQTKGFKVDIMSSNETGDGIYKEIVFGITGNGAYSIFKLESGVHRVQRVPKTEAQGRIHTSTVTVAVLAEVEDTDVEIRSDDLRIETCRAQGAGGQHVNKTESAIKIIHIPTGIVVQCQDERSQYKNKDRAMKILRAKLSEKYEREKKESIDSNRRSQIGSGDRSEKIRTYNYPQNRVTDHRINLTLYNLDYVMNGKLDELLESLSLAEKEEQLEDYLKKLRT